MMQVNILEAKTENYSFITHDRNIGIYDEKCIIRKKQHTQFDSLTILAIQSFFEDNRNKGG